MNTTSMNKTKIYLLALGVLLSISATAQNAREEFKSNPRLSGSCYTAYIEPTEALTPAPKGYEAFYLTHYGRHGSRWLCSDKQYTAVIDVLNKGDKCGKLTPKGKQLLQDLEEFHKTAKERIGDLTTVGERQHHGIGRRMAERFPEVFRNKACVDARSSFIMRCVLSMTAECEEIAAANPQVIFHNDVGACFQYYLDPNNYMTMTQKEEFSNTKNIVEQWRQKRTHPERLCKLLFNDIQWVNNNIDAVNFMRYLFDVASNMQSHDDGIDLYPLFTEEEIYDLWTVENIQSYLRHGSANETGATMPMVAAPLLKNIIETADRLVEKPGFNGATLRFGHEVDLMPLACLMGLGNSDTTVASLEDLEKVWSNYRIFPMAGNVQLVFYRGGKGKPILVKALLNEREVRLPIATNQYPYYEWSKLRAYYQKKME